MKLYRVVSQQEKDDFDSDDCFRTGINTLEAKQFFKSLPAIDHFVKRSKIQQYDPPYEWLLTITVDNSNFNNTIHTDGELDGYAAITIKEDNLPSFNKCITFVTKEAL